MSAKTITMRHKLTVSILRRVGDLIPPPQYKILSSAPSDNESLHTHFAAFNHLLEHTETTPAYDVKIFRQVCLTSKFYVDANLSNKLLFSPPGQN